MGVTVSCDCNLLSPKTQHDHTCLDRWRDGDQITNTQPLGQSCKKVGQTKSVLKKCATIEDAPL